MKRNSQALKLRTKHFALRVLKLYRSLPRSEEARILGKQLLRSSTSIGANYRAACRGRSRAEFLAKLGVVLEEADETVFWLEMLSDCDIVPAKKLVSLLAEAHELSALFTASQFTARRNR